MRQFDHVGIFTSEQHANESWVPSTEVWVTNPRLHPARIEYIRARSVPEIPDSDIGLWKLWHLPHIAFRVDRLDDALKGEEVILDPFEPADFVQAAFVHKDGAVIEYMEYRDLTRWFDQPTPWTAPGPDSVGLA